MLSTKMTCISTQERYFPLSAGAPPIDRHLHGVKVLFFHLPRPDIGSPKKRKVNGGHCGFNVL